MSNKCAWLVQARDSTTTLHAAPACDARSGPRLERMAKAECRPFLVALRRVLMSLYASSESDPSATLHGACGRRYSASTIYQHLIPMNNISDLSFEHPKLKFTEEEFKALQKDIAANL